MCCTMGERPPAALDGAADLHQLILTGAATCTMLFLCSAFVAGFLGFFFAQSAKVFTHYYTEQKWDLTRLVSSGGMPSSHTGLVMGLTTALGVLQGTSSPAFAIALVFSLIVRVDGADEHCRRPLLLILVVKSASIHTHCTSPQVMYDASGVRLHAGKQASVLNMIITEVSSSDSHDFTAEITGFALTALVASAATSANVHSALSLFAAATRPPSIVDPGPAQGYTGAYAAAGRQGYVPCCGWTFICYCVTGCATEQSCRVLT